MADLPADQTVTTSTRLWSEIVEEADPERDNESETAYVFSNGRKFENGNGAAVP